MLTRLVRACVMTQYVRTARLSTYVLRCVAILEPTVFPGVGPDFGRNHILDTTVFPGVRPEFLDL